MIIKYTVEITGHEAPFKWKVNNPTHQGMGTDARSGEGASYEDALFQASEAAHDMERQRKHAATRRTETLFEVDTEQEVEPGIDPLPGDPDEPY